MFKPAPTFHNPPKKKFIDRFKTSTVASEILGAEGPGTKTFGSVEFFWHNFSQYQNFSRFQQTSTKIKQTPCGKNTQSHPFHHFFHHLMNLFFEVDRLIPFFFAQVPFF